MHKPTSFCGFKLVKELILSAFEVTCELRERKNTHTKEKGDFVIFLL